MVEKKNKTIEQLNLQRRRKKNEKISFSYNTKEYLSLLKNYKLTVFVLIFIVLVVEMFRVIEGYLFKIVVDRGTEFSAGKIILNNFKSILVIIAVIYLSMVVMKAVLRWITLHLNNRLDAKLIFDLKGKYFNHILGLSHSFHVSHKTGSLIARLSRGSGAIEKLTDIIIWNFAPLILQFVVVVGSLILFDVKSAITISVMMAIFIFYSFWNQKIQQNANLKANEAEDIEKANISDSFTNFDSIRYFGKEDFIKAKFAKISEYTRKVRLIHWDYFRWLSTIQIFIIGLGTFFMVYFPLVDFLNGKAELGTVVFVYTIFLSLMGQLYGFVGGVRDYYRVMADFEDLFQYGKISNEIKDKENAGEAEIRNGEIEFRDMSFSYGNRKIFDKLSLKINKNEKVALVGHSGSGKTTLVKLLYRFYDLNSGKILIDNKDITDFKQESLRSELSIVPQEGILFDDTIYNNIAFSNPKATREQVFDAIKSAQLDKFILMLPNKENTIVGERGVKLSGGEKQRVSIARALLADKKILVLDEATSSLDSYTEYQIQRDFRKLMEGRTSIIIAHRLSTIMRADKIVVMDKGKIVQIGKHQELIKQSGLYKELWNLQKGGYLGE